MSILAQAHFVKSTPRQLANACNPSGAMPLVFQDEAPDYRYMILAKESGGRYVVMLISGVCTLAECCAFVSAYPDYKITTNDVNEIPDYKMYFQHEVTTKVSGFSPKEPGQSMLAWLIYFAEHFGQLRFIDAYTFHVSKHLLLSMCPWL